MPRIRKGANQYPPVFWNFLASAITKGKEELTLPSSQDAIRMRMQLYNFRLALLRDIQEKLINPVEPWMHQSLNIILSIEKLPGGKAKLTATCFEAYFSKLNSQLLNLPSAPGKPLSEEEIIQQSTMQMLQKYAPDEGQIVQDDAEDCIIKWLNETPPAIE